MPGEIGLLSHAKQRFRRISSYFQPSQRSFVGDPERGVRVPIALLVLDVRQTLSHLAYTYIYICICAYMCNTQIDKQINKSINT